VPYGNENMELLKELFLSKENTYITRRIYLSYIVIPIICIVQWYLEIADSNNTIFIKTITLIFSLSISILAFVIIKLIYFKLKINYLIKTMILIILFGITIMIILYFPSIVCVTTSELNLNEFKKLF